MGVLLDTQLDVALVRRLAQGDTGALSELYDRYASVLYTVAFRILGDRESAEDLVQDVFMEAWKKAADYDPGRASVRTWLILRARSRALDRATSAPRRRSVSLEDETVPEPIAAPSSGLDGIGDVERLQDALAGLSPEQRQVLELTFFRGLSSSDISREVGIPVGTVKSRLRAGLTGLRSALAPKDLQ